MLNLCGEKLNLILCTMNVYMVIGSFERNDLVNVAHMFRKENGIVSTNRIGNTDLPLMHIQPASHHRPSIADSAGHTKQLSPMFQRRVTQPLACMMPTAGSLNSVCPVTASTSTVGSLSNPLVGVSQQLLRPQVTTKVYTTALKPAATMPLPAGFQTEADYMLRFRLIFCLRLYCSTFKMCILV